MSMPNPSNEAYSGLLQRIARQLKIRVPPRAIAVIPMIVDGKRKIAVRVVDTTARDFRNLPCVWETFVSKPRFAYSVTKRLYGTDQNVLVLYHRTFGGNSVHRRWTWVGWPGLKPRLIRGKKISSDYNLC